MKNHSKKIGDGKTDNYAFECKKNLTLIYIEWINLKIIRIFFKPLLNDIIKNIRKDIKNDKSKMIR